MKLSREALKKIIKEELQEMSYSIKEVDEADKCDHCHGFKKEPRVCTACTETDGKCTTCKGQKGQPYDTYGGPGGQGMMDCADCKPDATTGRPSGFCGKCGGWKFLVTKQDCKKCGGSGLSSNPAMPSKQVPAPIAFQERKKR